VGAHVIDGRGLAAELKGRLAAEVADFMEAGVVPGLATVLVGSPAEAEAYERRVRKLAGELGYRYACERLPIDAEEAEVIATVGKLKSDPRVSGILVLKPLPDHVSEAAVYRALDPLKDIEAVHPVNAGLLALGRPRYVPSTPAVAFHMLDRYLVGSRRDPAEFYPSSNVVFVGRSNNVGKPALSLGFLRNATVISCEEHAHNAGRLAEFTKQADVLIVAAGVPGLIKKEHVREGVIAIDVGINSRRDSTPGRKASWATWTSSVSRPWPRRSRPCPVGSARSPSFGSSRTPPPPGSPPAPRKHGARWSRQTRGRTG
jgi:methylenetetrahydrofolate dehydrogenase (NADP+) / methenyltetrahydrofolate cyclohydrolase